MNFKTFAELEAAGWTRYSSRNSKLIARHAEGEIWIVDTSGRHSFGYSFAIRAFHGIDSNVTATTHAVWLGEELNRVGVKGCSVTAFHPSEYADGIERAKAWLDSMVGAPTLA